MRNGLITKTLCAIGALGACLAASLPAAAAEETQFRSVVDETGRTVRVPARIERVISLAPNLTETLFALGLEDRLVGVTNQCDYPPEARQKRIIGDVLNPNLEEIIELKPDLVFGTTAGNRRETVDAFERLGIPLYGIDPHSVEDVLVSVRTIAELLGVPERGAALEARLRARLAGLHQRLNSVSRPRVLFAIWLEPLITVGGDTFLNDLLRRAGARSVTADIRADWPRLSLEVALELDPDFLVLPNSHSLKNRLADLSQRRPWQGLRAVEQGRVVWMDDAVLRPGPRIVDVIETLARELHPEAFTATEAARQ
ncbi:MAG: ABC transporter substrate-binding protein [Candidatus Acidiferrales bacterium]